MAVGAELHPAGGRAQDPAQGRGRGAGRRGALPARGRGGEPPGPPEHRDPLRLRPHPRRRDLHGHGAPGRGEPGPGPPQDGPHGPRPGPAHHPPGLPEPRRGPRQGDRPPGREAPQHHAPPAPGGAGLREGPGLRRGQVGPRGPPAHHHGHDLRDAGVHEPRAGPVQAPGPPDGSLQRRRDPLHPPRGPAALPGGVRDHRCPAAHQQAHAGPPREPRGAAGGGAPHPRPDHEGPRPSSLLRRGGRRDLRGDPQGHGAGPRHHRPEGRPLVRAGDRGAGRDPGDRAVAALGESGRGGVSGRCGRPFRADSGCGRCSRAGVRG